MHGMHLASGQIIENLEDSKDATCIEAIPVPMTGLSVIVRRASRPMSLNPAMTNASACAFSIMRCIIPKISM